MQESSEERVTEHDAAARKGERFELAERGAHYLIHPSVVVVVVVVVVGNSDAECGEPLVESQPPHTAKVNKNDTCSLDAESVRRVE